MIWPFSKFSDHAGPLADITLYGRSILLRPPRLDDYAEWQNVRSENAERLRAYEPLWGDEALSRDNFERRLKAQARFWREGQSCAFHVFLKADQRLVGGMNINNICRGAAQFASLGYWIDQAHEGKGLMSEAIQETLNFGFKALKLHRIHASCLPHNTRSKNLLLRNGFCEEGFARKYIQINGVWEDHILFGLPIEEWTAQIKTRAN